MPKPTPADEGLAHKASTKGVPITPGQVKDYREAGFLQRTIREGRGSGGGRGWRAHYSDEAVAHVRDLVRQINAYGRRADAVLATFLHGFDPRERGLRWAYREGFDRRLGKMLEQPPTLDDLSRAGRALARTPASQEWEQALQDRVRSETPSVNETADVFENVLAVATGEHSYLAPETLTAVGLEGDPAPFMRVIEQAPILALPALVKEAPFEELVQARDLYRQTGPWFPLPEPDQALLFIPFTLMAIRTFTEAKLPEER